MNEVVRRPVEDPHWSDATSADPTEDFSSTCLLLLLDERPATAGELCFRLRRLGLIEDDADPGRVEAVLLALEHDGLVECVQIEEGLAEASIYSLTDEGAESLGIASDDLRSTQVLLDRFLARYAERLGP